MSKTYIVASVGEWNRDLYEINTPSLLGEWYFASDNEELLSLLDNVKPEYIFFPHWRWIVPRDVVEKFDCVCFHMTDLPYGRGGSPLQNLILRGHKSTVLTALKMTEGLDAGPVYLKKPLSLDGNAGEIYKRASAIVWEIIKEMIGRDIKPAPQIGSPTLFRRRTPAESEMPHSISQEQVYDFIRMLDAPGYPRAFIRHGKYRLEFDDASFDGSGTCARVRFIIDEG